jgi:hypothetical protein
MTETRKEESTISTIGRMLDNVEGLIDFDINVYVTAFGENAVSTIQRQAEVMPETNSDGFAIQAMLNIAYDQGFQDCIDMIRRVIGNVGAL